MNNTIEKNTFQMVRLGPDTLEELEEYDKNRIAINKRFSKIQALARENAKRKTCALCGTECSSFCNSHSIPQFVLKRISENGKVSSALRAEIPMLNGAESGVKQTGTFHFICAHCDSVVFQDYENPSSYSTPPDDKVLSQIALKNYLHLIFKREHERELYKIMGDQYPYNKAFADEKRSIADFDLKGYNSSLEYCKKALKDNLGSYFYLCYFEVLDYVVPIAAQAAVSLISDFEDNVVNNVYNFDSKYEVKELHLAVFPLENTSIVMMFIKDEEKRYRKFYKQFSKLSLSDKLVAINYMLFSYSENVFIEPTTYSKIQSDNKFADICRKTTDYYTSFPFFEGTPLERAVNEFSFSKMYDIPNLLDRHYSMS